jgi:hypothetical protein
LIRLVRRFGYRRRPTFATIKKRLLAAAKWSDLMSTIRHYRGLDISLLVYPSRATQAGFGRNYEEGFDASIRISEPDSGMDSLRSRIFRVPARRPFLSTGDARRACLAYAEMLIDAGGSSRAIWEPV